MRRLIFALLLVLLFVPAYAGEITAPVLNPKGVLLPNNYICDGSALGVDLLCGLEGYWRFDDLNANNGLEYDGSSGQVKDISGNSTHAIKENLVPNSEDLTTGWTPGGTPIVTTTTIEDDAATFESLYVQVAAVAGQPYTASISVPKKGSQSKYAGIAVISLTGGSTIQSGVTIDPTGSGSLTVRTGGGITAPTASSIAEDPDDSDYWRVTISDVVGTSNTQVRIQLYPAVNANGSATWDATETGTNTFERSQLEQSSSASAYISTSGSAVERFYNNGRSINGLVTNSSGRIGRAADFVVGDLEYINLDSPTDSLKLLSGGTITGCINPRAGAGGGNAGRIMIGPGGSWDLFIDNSGRIRTNISGSGTNALSTTSALTFAAWNHFVATIESTGVTFYIDGVDVTSNAGDGTLPPDVGGDVRIGARISDTARNFDGLIDELKVYDRILNAGEIAADYNGGRCKIIQ